MKTTQIIIGRKKRRKRRGITRSQKLKKILKFSTSNIELFKNGKKYFNVPDLKNVIFEIQETGTLFFEARYKLKTERWWSEDWFFRGGWKFKGISPYVNKHIDKEIKEYLKNFEFDDDDNSISFIYKGPGEFDLENHTVRKIKSVKKLFKIKFLKNREYTKTKEILMNFLIKKGKFYQQRKKSVSIYWENVK